jgi:hypothetical protein
MYKYRYVLALWLLGLCLVVTSQIAVLGEHYSNSWGDTWAIVCFSGLTIVSIAVSLIIVACVNHLKHTFFNTTIRVQTFGIVLITNLAVLYCLQSVLSQSDELTMSDGDARRGVFIIWLALIIFFTLVNSLLGALRAIRLKIKKQKVNWF